MQQLRKAAVEKAIARIKNPVTAIRARCLNCCGGEVGAVRTCLLNECSLWPFRFGCDPYRGKPKPDNHLSPLKSIRAECLACSGSSY